MGNTNTSTKKSYMKSLSWKKRVALFVMVLLFVPQYSARADMGPKPTMEFVFVQEFDPPLTIVEGDLIECEDFACTQSLPLEELGPQGFSCELDRCSSMAYGYSDYHRLVIRFSDGKVRESNIFANRHFDAVYQVTVREDDLVVKEDVWRSNSAFAGLFSFILWLCGIPFLLVAALLILAWLTKRANNDLLTFPESRKPYILAWAVSVLMFFVGGLFSLTLPLTILLEALLGGVYAKLRKRTMITIVTLVILVNSITQPLLMFAFWIFDTNGLAEALVYLFIFEILIWVGEAVMLYLPLRKEISFREALVVSLLLNTTSFLVGLFLRV